MNPPKARFLSLVFLTGRPLTVSATWRMRLCSMTSSPAWRTSGSSQLYGINSDEPLLEAMRRVGLDPQLSRRVGQYSQGMRQRLSLARAIFHSPRLLLLDEPFSNVDPESALQIAKLLADMRSAGTTILLVTHQLGLLANLADEYLMLSHGQLVDRGFMP